MKKIKNEPPVYAVEGSVANCGSLIQWLRDNMLFIDSASQSEVFLFLKLYIFKKKGNCKKC